MNPTPEPDSPASAEASGTESPSPGDAAGASEHVRPPRQERSRKTLERIVGAALEIIEEEGVRGVTVSAVVERARSSVGSFYARFEGKEDLLHYLEERVWRKARRRWEKARRERQWGALDLEGVVRSMVELLVRIHREDAGTRRALGRDAVGEALGEEARRFHALLATEVRDLLLLRRDSIQHPSPERAARVAYGWAVGGIRELLRTGKRGDEALAPEEVADEVTRGLVAYLSGGVEDLEEAEEVEFFDVWQ